MKGRLVISVIASLALAGCGYGHDVGPQVTRDRIRAIQLGMTRSEVEHIIGKPFRNVPAEPSAIVERSANVLLYSRPVSGVRFYPMLWVHLRDGKVSQVYAKEYDGWFWDDRMVYGLTEKHRLEDPDFNRLFPE